MAMFSKEKTLPKAKTTAKPTKEQVFMAGLEDVAALDAVIKSLQAIKEMKDAQVKADMADHFKTKGVELKKAPESFRGHEGNAEASCEMRKRSTNSTLTVEEVELLTAKGIPTEVITSTVETYVINPAYVNDTELLGKIEKSLKKVSGIPDDLFVLQEGVSKTVVGADALNVMFGTGDKELIEELFSVVTVLAIKPKMTTDDMEVAFKIVEKLIDKTEEAA